MPMSRDIETQNSVITVDHITTKESDTVSDGTVDSISDVEK